MLAKAPIPAYLKALIQAFEVSEEAKHFVVMPPPKDAGEVFLFSMPYFHGHNKQIFKRQMSEELHMLVAALAEGLTFYLAYYTQLKHQQPYVGFKQSDIERYEIALSSHLPLDEQTSLTINNCAACGDMQYIGVKTELGIFPACTIARLQATTNMLRSYQANIQPSSGEDVMLRPSVYHVFSAVPPAFGYEGNTWSSGGYTPSFLVPTPASSVARQEPNDETDMLTLPALKANEKILGSFFRHLMIKSNYSLVDVERLIDEFVHNTTNVGEMEDGELEAKISRLTRKVMAENMSWPIFCLGLHLLGVADANITVVGNSIDYGGLVVSQNIVTGHG